MVNFKKIIAEKIAKVAELNIEEIESFNYQNQRIGVIAHIENELGNILLQQRGIKSRDENGLYEDVGGGFDKGDKNFKSAIIREIKEEMGDKVNIELSNSIGIFHVYKNNINWLMIIFYGKYIDGEIKVMEPDKCLGYKFFTYEEALESDMVTNSCKFLIKNMKNVKKHF